MLSESERIKRAIERVADAEIEKKTAPCFRTYKAIVTEAPNGATCKVRLCGDDTELELPYASKLASIPVGKYVWVGAFYNVDNSMSNAIVWDTLKFDISGGSTIVVDDALSTVSENPVQNKVITNTINTLPHEGIFYVTEANSVAAKTSKPYYSSQWNGTNANVTSYYTGLTIAFKIGVAGNGTYGTVLNINGLGQHPVLKNVSTMISTSYGVGSMIVLTYDASATGTVYINSNSSSTITGAWKVSDYDTTNVYQLRKNSGTIDVNANSGSLYRYMLCMTTMNEELIPFNNQSSSQTTTYTKVMNTTAFNPFGDIYWYISTTDLSAGEAAAASVLFRQYAYDIRYSLNIYSSGTAGTTALTSGKPVYLRCEFDPATGLATFTQSLTSTSYLERSSIVQALPTTNPDAGRMPTDNHFYIYIYLGQAYSKYQMELSVLHPVFYWNGANGNMEQFFGIPSTASKTFVNAVNALIDAKLANYQPSYTQTTTLFSGSASVESI